MIIVLISLDLRVILNKISGVKCNFVVRFPLGHVYNKVKDKHILLNSIKTIYHWVVYFIKRGSCVR